MNHLEWGSHACATKLAFLLSRVTGKRGREDDTGYRKVMFLKMSSKKKIVGVVVAKKVQGLQYVVPENNVNNSKASCFDMFPKTIQGGRLTSIISRKKQEEKNSRLKLSSAT